MASYFDRLMNDPAFVVGLTMMQGGDAAQGLAAFNQSQEYTKQAQQRAAFDKMAASDPMLSRYAELGPEMAMKMAELSRQQQMYDSRDRLMSQYGVSQGGAPAAPTLPPPPVQPGGEPVMPPVPQMPDPVADLEAEATQLAKLSVLDPAVAPLAADARARLTRAQQLQDEKIKAPTEAQANSSAYLTRMREASQILDSLETKGISTADVENYAKSKVPVIGNFLVPGEFQQYTQAQEDWVRAKLRKESGAVIADDEMAREISTYFPQPGDKPEAIAQKQQARQVAERALEKGVGQNINTAPSAKNQNKPANNPIIMKHPKYGDVSEADITTTMKAMGMTREQVMKKLGAK